MNVESDGTVLRNVDGLVIAGILRHYIGAQKLLEFCQRYHTIPIVGPEMTLPGILGVVLDFYQGMREVLAHLLEDHGYRRIALVRSPGKSVTGEEMLYGGRIHHWKRNKRSFHMSKTPEKRDIK